MLPELPKQSLIKGPVAHLQQMQRREHIDWHHKYTTIKTTLTQIQQVTQDWNRFILRKGKGGVCGDKEYIHWLNYS
jgi:hypothetical protein